MANLDITERRNHQFVTSYVKAGADATVVWGSQDFKFKNTRKYPIRITATVEGGVATVQVWGVKEDVEYDISIETKKTETISYKTQYVQDASLPVGEQKVIQAGSNGRKVEAYKVTKLNGEVISKTLLSKDTYNAMSKIVHVGTAQ
jgi:vancomycin resistance protein YoaR